MIIQGYQGSGLEPFISRLGTSGQQDNTWSLRTESTAERTGISQTFAQDVIRRIESQPSQEPVAAETEGQEQQPAAESRDAGELEAALGRAVDFIESNFGEKAATLTMALVYKNIGDGPVTEDALGQGLLSALKVIDRDFGIEAGDRLMAFLNNDLNQAMNDYFDNGLMETFYAVGSEPGQVAPSALTTALGKVAENYGQEAADTVLDILKQGLEGGTPKSLNKSVAEARHYLQEQYGPPGHADVPGQALSGLARPLLPGQIAQATGQALDIAV